MAERKIKMKSQSGSKKQQIAGFCSGGFSIIVLPLLFLLFSGMASRGGCDPCDQNPPDCSRCTDPYICPVTNQPPYVNAGPDLVNIQVGQSVFLDGYVSDDGRPYGTLTQNWTKIIYPGAVTFSSPTSVDTNAIFSAVGTYVLQLTASDGQLSGSDQMHVYVIATPVNQPPVAVGADSAVTVDEGTESVTVNLNGTGSSDDGLPNPPGQLTYSWVYSGGGPAGVTVNIQTPSSSVSGVTISETDPSPGHVLTGTYNFVLTVSDSQYVDSDTVTVTITEIVVPSPPHVVDAGPDQTVLTASECAENWPGVGWPGNNENPIKFSLTGQGMTGSGQPLVSEWSILGTSPTTDVQLYNSSAPNTTVTLPTGTNYSGYYKFQLTVDDEATDTDAVVATDTVTVNVCGSDNKQAPQIELKHVNKHFPQNLLAYPVVIDAGSSTTDEDGVDASSWQWTTWSGPNGTDVTDPTTVTFDNTNSSVPTVSFSELGHYVLTAAVSDSHALPLQAKVHINVDVLPAMWPLDVGILSSQGEGAGTMTPSVGLHEYGHDANATVSAIPTTGFGLAGWSIFDIEDPNADIPYTTAGNGISFQVSGKYKVNAVFIKDES